MSRTIDPEKIASGDLDEDERRYLQDRGLLPKGVERVDDQLAKSAPLEEQANTGTANTAGTSIEELEEAQTEAKRMQNRLPTIADRGGIEVVDDSLGPVELDYEEMNNQERRAELSRRGLIVTGNKDELISRLRRSDADQLQPADQAEPETTDEEDEE